MLSAIAVLAIAAGFLAAGVSLFYQPVSGEQLAILAVAAFAFAIAAGVWRIHSVIEQHLSDLYDE